MCFLNKTSGYIDYKEDIHMTGVKIALAHNGNFTNAGEIRKDLVDKYIFKTHKKKH